MGTDSDSEWEHLDWLHRRAKIQSRAIVGGALAVALVMAWVAGTRVMVDDYWLTGLFTVGAVGGTALAGRSAFRMGATERDFEYTREKRPPPDEQT